MSEFDLHTRKASSQNQGPTSSQNLKDQVADAGAEVKQRAGDAGAEVKQRAGDALRASTDIARDKFKEAADSAKDVAAGAADRFQDKAEEQQRTGADFVGRLAGNIRQAAHAFESDAPFAARGINSAADYVEDAAERIRSGTFRDLIDGANDFASKQPTAFLGLTVLAGFAAIRFLKTSGNPASSSKGEEAS